MIPPENVAKLKHFWCVFHDSQPINLTYRSDLSDNTAGQVCNSNRLLFFTSLHNFFVSDALLLEFFPTPPPSLL